MEKIKDFILEMKRTEWLDTSNDKRYNGISIQQSSISYQKLLSALYTEAVLELANLSAEQQSILSQLIEEVEECQECFEIPSDELLESLIKDYRNGNYHIKGLKEDYEFLKFVRECMVQQQYYLRLFKKKIPPVFQTSQEETESAEKSKVKELPCPVENNPIKGVRGLAAFLKISTTKAQSILKSEILQKEGIAYRVGKGWNIN